MPKRAAGAARCGRATTPAGGLGTAAAVTAAWSLILTALSCARAHFSAFTWLGPRADSALNAKEEVSEFASTAQLASMPARVLRRRDLAYEDAAAAGEV